MKKIIPILILIFIFNLLAAQFAYMGAGYNLSSGPFEKFNYIIDRYNETREDLDLDPKMKNIHLNHGMTFEFGLVMPNFLFGLGLQYNRVKTVAKLIDDNNVKQQRDLLLRAFSMPFDLGVILGGDGFVAAPGAGVNFMFHRYFTRSGPAKDIDDIEYYKSDTSVAMHAKLFVKFFLGGRSGLKFMVEPFYNLSIFGSDISEMNRALNPYTWNDDPYEITESFTHYGIRLLLVIRTS